jgi:copper(I)-binding protein
MRNFWLTAGLALLLPAAPVPAETWRAGALEVMQPWARETTPMQKNGAVYLTIHNGGPEADRLIEAASPAAERVELHTHEIDAQGVATMRRVPAIEVPAAGEVALKSGGAHIMLFGLRRPLHEGARFPLMLRFAKAGQVEVQVAVADVRGPDHDGHGDGHGPASAGAH